MSSPCCICPAMTWWPCSWHGTRLPTMTNRQVKDVAPAAWAKAQALTDQRQAA